MKEAKFRCISGTLIIFLAIVFIQINFVNIGQKNPERTNNWGWDHVTKCKSSQECRFGNWTNRAINSSKCYWFEGTGFVSDNGAIFTTVTIPPNYDFLLEWYLASHLIRGGQHALVCLEVNGENVSDDKYCWTENNRSIENDFIRVIFRGNYSDSNMLVNHPKDYNISFVFSSEQALDIRKSTWFYLCNVHFSMHCPAPEDAEIWCIATMTLGLSIFPVLLFIFVLCDIVCYWFGSERDEISKDNNFIAIMLLVLHCTSVVFLWLSLFNVCYDYPFARPVVIAIFTATLVLSAMHLNGRMKRSPNLKSFLSGCTLHVSILILLLVAMCTFLILLQTHVVFSFWVSWWAAFFTALIKPINNGLHRRHRCTERREYVELDNSPKGMVTIATFVLILLMTGTVLAVLPILPLPVTSLALFLSGIGTNLVAVLVFPILKWLFKSLTGVNSLVYPLSVSFSLAIIVTSYLVVYVISGGTTEIAPKWVTLTTSFADGVIVSLLLYLLREGKNNGRSHHPKICSLSHVQDKT